MILDGTLRLELLLEDEQVNRFLEVSERDLDDLLWLFCDFLRN